MNIDLLLFDIRCLRSEATLRTDPSLVSRTLALLERLAIEVRELRYPPDELARQLTNDSRCVCGVGGPWPSICPVHYVEETDD